MNNLYKETLDEIRLDDAAKNRIFNNVVNELQEQNEKAASKKPVSFSMKAFRVAAACASVALVCGTALGTGLYFGLNGNGNGDFGYSNYPGGGGSGSGGGNGILNEVGPHYYCYYMGYDFEQKEYDIDNVELTLYYAFNEEDIRGRYAQVCKDAEYSGFGKVLKYEAFLEAYNGWRVGVEDMEVERVVLKTFDFTDMDAFPFEDYKINIVEENGETVKRTYTHSEKIVMPPELMAKANERSVYAGICMCEKIEYEVGLGRELKEIDIAVGWSENGRVYVDAMSGYKSNDFIFYYNLVAGKISVRRICTEFNTYPIY